MIETVMGIWLLLLTGSVGFLWGRYGKKKPKTWAKSKKSVTMQQEIGWYELLNFLQYDGSGKLPSVEYERGDVKGETKNFSRTDRSGIRPRRSV